MSSRLSAWGADLHIAQQMPLPLTISCSSKSRLVLTFLVLPFWYPLTRVDPDILQTSSKTIVCVWEEVHKRKTQQNGVKHDMIFFNFLDWMHWCRSLKEIKWQVATTGMLLLNWYSTCMGTCWYNDFIFQASQSYRVHGSLPAEAQERVRLMTLPLFSQCLLVLVIAMQITCVLRWCSLFLVLSTFTVFYTVFALMLFCEGVASCMQCNKLF